MADPSPRPSRLTHLARRVVTIPGIYDWVQGIVGGRQSAALVAQHIPELRSRLRVLDIGGGTGSLSRLFSRTSTYVCLDLDRLKLGRFHHKDPAGIALVADGARIPIKTQSIDLVLCINVSHHLAEDILQLAIGEAFRVLKPDGRFLFHDAVWEPSRTFSQLLWKFDRGSFPRPMDALHRTLATHGTIVHWKVYAVYHRYVMGVIQPDLTTPS